MEICAVSGNTARKDARTQAAHALQPQDQQERAEKTLLNVRGEDACQGRIEDMRTKAERRQELTRRGFDEGRLHPFFKPLAGNWEERYVSQVQGPAQNMRRQRCARICARRRRGAVVGKRKTTTAQPSVEMEGQSAAGKIWKSCPADRVRALVVQDETAAVRAPSARRRHPETSAAELVRSPPPHHGPLTDHQPRQPAGPSLLPELSRLILMPISQSARSSIPSLSWVCLL